MSTHHGERDAWLSQALRHAPDANADAPPALSEAILREARIAVAQPDASARTTMRGSRCAAVRWFMSAWGWLARPTVAAGFASVMVATLVGLMWWDKPLDHGLPRPSQPLPARIEAAPAAPTAAASPQRPPTPAPQAEAATAEPAPARLVQKRERAAPAAPAAAESSAPAAQRVAEPAAPDAMAKAAPQRDESRFAQGSVAAPRTATQAANGIASPLAGSLASVTQQPERWRWRRGGAEAKAMTPELERWLMRLDVSTERRWRTSNAAAPHDARALSLWRDGVLQLTLGFTPDAVWVAAGQAPDPALASVIALLPATSLETLRQALDDATP